MAASDAERRRLERNLHDGAQQRLVSVALQLRMIQAPHPHRPGAGRAARQLGRATSSSQSLEELRELARGIHPAALNHGLRPRSTSLGLARAVPDRGLLRGPGAPARAGRARGLLRRLRGARQRREVRARDTERAIRVSRRDGDARRSRSPTTASAAPTSRRHRAAGPGRPRRRARRGARASPARRAAGPPSPRSCRARRDRRRQPPPARGHRVASLRGEGIEVVAAGGDRRRAARGGRRARARRGHRRHPHAADPHRRGHPAAHEIRRRHPAMGDRRSSPSTSRSASRRSCWPRAPQRLGYLLKDRVTDPAGLRRLAAARRGAAAPPSTRRSCRGCSAGPARERPARAADAARARGPRAGRRGPLEQGDRRTAGHHPARRAEARQHDLQQARPPRGRERRPPHPGRARLPAQRLRATAFLVGSRRGAIVRARLV